MKTHFSFTVIFTLFIFTFAKSQSGFEFGPVFQYQNTWIINDNDMSTGPKLDYETTLNTAIGGQLGIGFNANHGIRLGFFMSKQGQNYTTSQDFIDLPGAQYYTKFEYYNIPVLYRYVADLSKRNSAFILHLGPQFGLLQKSRSTVLIPKTPLNPAFISDEVDSKDFYNSMDIAANFGLGIIVRFSKALHMNTMLNMVYSINDIEKTDKKPADRVSSNNAIIGLQVGLYYLLAGPDYADKAKFRP
jgi:hypothetical protein